MDMDTGKKEDAFARAARLLKEIRSETERVRKEIKKLNSQRENSLLMSTCGHSAIIFSKGE